MNNKTEGEDEWVYAWEEDLYDEDGVLWIITMMTMMISPFYECFYINPILFPDLLEVISGQE